jgi:hypothetical protein
MPYQQSQRGAVFLEKPAGSNYIAPMFASWPRCAPTGRQSVPYGEEPNVNLSRQKENRSYGQPQEFHGGNPSSTGTKPPGEEDFVHQGDRVSYVSMG